MYRFFYFWKRGEIVESYQRAEADYMAGMKYKDIAEKYDTTINTVKSWKKRHGWDRKKGAHKKGKGCTQNKRREPVSKAQDDGTKETLQNEELTPEQQIFCIYYSRTFNATQSYLKAYGCSYEAALGAGPRLLGNVRVRAEIERLKELKRQQIMISEDDIVELQTRIACADMGNYVSFGSKGVKLHESKTTDTQLIQEVKEGKSGVSVKLSDKQKAIDWLTKYFLMHPENKYRAEFERRRAEKEGGETQEFESDGFLEALKGEAAATFEGDGIVET